VNAPGRELRTSISKRETGDGNGASRGERESAPAGPQPSGEDERTRDGHAFAEIIAVLSAAFVVNEESNATATSRERIGRSDGGHGERVHPGAAPN
jgi:hypothetical protein